MPIRLNLGAGKSVIEGFTPVDRRNGRDVYPLVGYANNSVDEIRASHILEHFGHADVPRVLAEWVRVLKPGSRIRIAVPDFDKIRTMQDPRWRAYLMGGQVDENDSHKSVFTEELLRGAMQQAGIVNIESWISENTDCASLPVSLNLQGVKPAGGEAIKLEGIQQETVKICAVMSLPRVGWNDNWGCILEALGPFNIPVRRFTGVYWGQCMQRVLTECVEDKLDWILTVDYDSLFTAQQLDTLMGHFGRNPKIDALAALQCRRAGCAPLITIEGKRDVEVTGEPLQVTTAHFGLTVIRADALADIPKPWFKAVPDDAGDWGDKRMDDDIWFWHQWKQHGKTVFVDPDVRIGHLELMVNEFTEKMEQRYVTVQDWRKAVGIDVRDLS